MLNQTWPRNMLVADCRWGLVVVVNASEWLVLPLVGAPQENHGVVKETKL